MYKLEIYPEYLAIFGLDRRCTKLYERNSLTLKEKDFFSHFLLNGGFTKFIDILNGSKVRTLQFVDCFYLEFDLINNYTILNFTVNDKQPDYAYEILNRNKNYAFTVLLCMNRKIIPRCVFKNLILKHLFIL